MKRRTTVRVALLCSRAVPERLTYKLGAGLPEPLVELNLARIQGEADRLFGEILSECAIRMRPFPRTANEAFRKRDSGEPLDGLERSVIALFDKIEAIELLREMKG